MLFLVLSIVALAVGPILFRLAQRSGSRLAQTGLDVLIILAVGGIVLLHILPDSIRNGGWFSIVFLVLGLLGPTVLESWLHRAARQAHGLVGMIVIVGIVAHALVDGVALAVSEIRAAETSHALSLAVALHRLPVGLILWWLIRPRFGVRVAVAVLVGIGVVSVVGFALGGLVVASLHSEGLAWFGAFVAGSLLHVAVHQRGGHRHASSTDGHREP